MASFLARLRVSGYWRISDLRRPSSSLHQSEFSCGLEKVQTIPGIQDTHTIITFKAFGQS
jgi:hypothetical protein